jgi:hypothetical protein
VYDHVKEAYYYDNKIVGILADEESWGVVFLNPAAGIHLKVLRSHDGLITEIVELSSAEYTKIIEESEARGAFINERRALLNASRDALNERRQSLLERP